MKLNFHYSAPLEICFFMVSFFAKVINVSDSGPKVRRLSIKFVSTISSLEEGAEMWARLPSFLL